MNKIATFLMLCVALAISNSLQAQEVATPEMADAMRSEGKIYVVVAILVTIFAGLIAYLITLDRKVTRIEKKITEMRG